MTGASQRNQQVSEVDATAVTPQVAKSALVVITSVVSAESS
jgi:hypothetical protein